MLGDNDTCQRPTCNSHDPARIIAFETAPGPGPGDTTQYSGTFDITLLAL